MNIIRTIGHAEAKNTQIQTPYFILLGCVILMALSPLDPYRVPFAGMNWSLQRIFLIFYFPVFFIFYSRSYRDTFTLPYFFSIGVIISLAFSLLSPSANYDLFRIYAPLDLLNMLIFVIIFYLTKKNTLNSDNILTGFFYVGILYSLYSSYSVYEIFYQKKMITTVPLEGYLPTITEDSIRFESLSRQMRLYLPFGVPQALGASTGLLSLIFTRCYLKEKAMKWLLLIFSMITITFLTFSRSAIYPLFVAFLVIFFVPFVLKFAVSKKLLFYSFFVPFFLFGIFSFSSNNDLPVARLLDMNIESSSTQAHFNIRKIALGIFLDAPLLEKFFGYGVGNFRIHGGANRAHMTYANVLVERGLIGLLASCLIFFVLPARAFIFYNRGDRNDTDNLTWLAMSIYIFLAHLFYSLFITTSLWMIYGFLCGQLWSEEYKFKA